MSTQVDILFRNVSVCDGSGGAPFDADVAVSGERISAIGKLEAASGLVEIDGSGKVLSPGFIDVHTHDDRYLLDEPSVPAKTSQGVTTVVLGNCGSSLAPVRDTYRPDPLLETLFDSKKYRFSSVADYIYRLNRKPAALNSLVLVGHTTLRLNCMSELDRPARDREIQTMQDVLQEGLEAGAVGLSSGVFYEPAAAATADEIIGVGEKLSDYNGLYATHIRDEANLVIESIEEAAYVAKTLNVQLILSHHKTTGRENFGRTRETLQLIDTLAQRQHISLDVYPYTASSTALLVDELQYSDKILITRCPNYPQFVGKYLSDLAADLGASEAEAVDIISPASAVYFQMHEDDVQRVLRYGRTMIGSDGAPWDEHPHPRLWGTFPRTLGHYSRELRLFPLEEAIHRMTGLPAFELGLVGRGFIKGGYFADLVLFDPNAIQEGGSYQDPKQPAKGIELVLVNGEAVWRGAEATGARPGKPIRMNETRRSP